MTLKDNKNLLIGLALIALMAATRFDHFGSAVSLPDASLAVFFLAGFYLARWALPLLLLEAVAIDFVAVNAMGVSDWCITPAYSFLAAAYGAMWLAGRWYRRGHALTWRSLLPLAGAAVTATLAAFFISNASFYLLSGYFADMSAADYAAAVAQYLPGYLRGALIWLALAGTVHVLLHATKVRPVKANV